MSDLVGVMFCCNSSNAGAFTGRVKRISAPDLVDVDCYIDFEDDDWEWSESTGLSLVWGEAEVTVGGVAYPHHGHTEWVGNWSHDQAWMEVEVCARLLVQLREAGWSLCEADPRLYEAWNCNDAITAGLLENCMEVG